MILKRSGFPDLFCSLLTFTPPGALIMIDKNIYRESCEWAISAMVESIFFGWDLLPR
jgi:hypothetical protein